MELGETGVNLHTILSASAAIAVYRFFSSRSEGVSRNNHGTLAYVKRAIGLDTHMRKISSVIMWLISAHVHALLLVGVICLHGRFRARPPFDHGR